MVEPSDESPESDLEKHLGEVIGQAILHNLEVDQVALAMHAALCDQTPCPHTSADMTAQDQVRAKAAIRELRRWTPSPHGTDDDIARGE